MNAVVSGQAGVALLLDGDTLSSLRASRPGEVVRRSPGEVPLLFGDAKDLQFLEGVELEEVSSRLERASEQMDAFHLALILLDETLEPDTRRTAAEELEELLEIEENLRFVENLLYAHPLPRGADLVGALASCPGNANLTRRLLERLGSLQGVIAEVYFAWEQIPEELFDGKRDRAHAQSIAAREGFFRDLVALRSAESSIDRFLRRALLNEPFRGVHNHRDILHAWLSPLRDDQRSRPSHVERQKAAIVEAMEQRHSIGLVREALAGNQDARTRLVAALTPVIEARVARTLLARRSYLGADRNVRQEVEDLTQEIFLSLLAKDAHVLRSWQPERGLSLENFVGLVSERQVVSFLRSGKRNPWKVEPSQLEDLAGEALDRGPEEIKASREQLRLLLERLQERLGPLGRQLFELLFIQERSLPETIAASGLSADAVYAWRSRLRRLARELLAELLGNSASARESPKDG